MDASRGQPVKESGEHIRPGRRCPAASKDKLSEPGAASQLRPQADCGLAVSLGPGLLPGREADADHEAVGDRAD